MIPNRAIHHICLFDFGFDKLLAFKKITPEFEGGIQSDGVVHFSGLAFTKLYQNCLHEPPV